MDSRDLEGMEARMSQAKRVGCAEERSGSAECA